MTNKSNNENKVKKVKIINLWSLMTNLKIIFKKFDMHIYPTAKGFIGWKYIDYQNSNWTKLDFC